MNFHADPGSGRPAGRPVLCSAILFPPPPSACEGDREVGDQCEAGHEHGSFLPASVSSSSFRMKKFRARWVFPSPSRR